MALRNHTVAEKRKIAHGIFNIGSSNDLRKLAPKNC